MREDILAAPLFALSFKNGASVTVLDPAPRGDTTEEETKLTRSVITDSRLQFGALGAWQADDGPIEFGFRFPATTSDYLRGSRSAGGSRRERRRPRTGIGAITRFRRAWPTATRVRFRFGQNESFPDLTRNSWRWAWNTLNPPINYIDVEQMRRVLIDHLQSQVATIDGRTGMPFVINTMSDEKQWNYTMVAMGFVGKNIECADQLLREGDRDKTERGQKMRQTGLAMISSLIQALPTVPLAGDRLRSINREAMDRAAAGVGRSLAAQCHRGHARADAGIPARESAGARASGVGQLGQERTWTG